MPERLDDERSTSASRRMLLARREQRAAARQDYLELKRMLRTLGDEVRLNIVHTLASGAEITVTDLAERLVVSQPLISWHLGALKRVGLAQTRRQGRQVYCSLDLTRYRLCLRMLGKVIEPTPDISAQGEAHQVVQPGPVARVSVAPQTAGG
ncbi:MAG TPA: metalloregulator ArsR/SmtB family transcription factor [Ktedonobacterales bacterium]|nr:metalloregulator ArsR/SmtB family transcription factor [Ktedonobacterales bacterium]